MRVHTHYDNLKVARNATPDIIRSAYAVLSEKYSPAKQPGSAEAARILLLVNTAYEVLSDPQRRNHHDRWIQEQEQGVAPDAEFATPAGAAPFLNANRWWPWVVSKISEVGAHVRKRWSLYVLAAIVVGVWAMYTPRRTFSPSAKPYGPDLWAPSADVASGEQAIQTPSDVSVAAPSVRTSYVRPIRAPNGLPWPRNAGYLPGYQRLNNNGFSRVTVDNGQDDADVFVKLVSLSGSAYRPVRTFFIPAGGSFTLIHVTPGHYDIRYKDLGTGETWRTDPFDLSETPEQSGTQYSDLSMTLYKVANGNMQTYPIPASQF